MSDFNNYRLTGGIFFALLLDSMSKSRLFSRAIPKNKQITQSDVLCDLFRVFNPSFEYTENETNKVILLGDCVDEKIETSKTTMNRVTS